MTARSFGDVAAQLLGSTEKRRRKRELPVDPVRNYSHNVDHPAANRWNRLWNGTWAEWNVWRDAVLAVAKDLRGKQRREDYRGENRLQGNDLLVLDALLSFMNPRTAELYPSKARIARRAGLHVDTVHESLKRWWNLGFIRWVRRWKPTDRQGEAGPQREQTSNGYYFDFQQLAAEIWRDLWAKVHRRVTGLREAARQRVAATSIAAPPGTKLAGATPALEAERDSEKLGTKRA